MKNDFWIGTSPFCNGKYSDCQKTPGYIGYEKNKRGDGKRCLFGNKVHCKFDMNEFKKSNEYKKMKEQCGDSMPENYKPEFRWFGTSPYCDVTEGEVASKGYLPIKRDNSGDGAPCLKGYKILGVKPIPGCQAQKDEMDLLIQKYKEEGSPNTFTRIIDTILNNINSDDPRVKIAKKGINFVKDVVTKKA